MAVVVLSEKITVVVPAGFAFNFLGVVARLEAPIALALGEMHLADPMRLVAQIVEFLDETGPITINGQVVNAAGLMRRNARGHRVPGRHANGAGRVAPAEAGALADEAVNVRCADLIIAQSGDTIGPQLIGENEEDIRG